MYTAEQKELMTRIWENFEKICDPNVIGLPDSAAVNAYERDIARLCEEDVFTPEVLNFAMDLMKEITVRREQHDSMNLARITAMTYANFRIE